MKHLILLALILLSGCTGLSKSDCEELDMIDAGYFDVTQGYDENHYDHWVERCQKHKFTPDKDLYFQGRKRAYYEFCNYETGYIDAQNQKVGVTFCPPDLKIKYNKGFAHGGGQKQSRNKNLGFTANLPQNKSCNKDQDCELKDSCKSNKCLLTGSSCLFDRDCTVNGTCSQQKCSY